MRTVTIELEDNYAREMAQRAKHAGMTAEVFARRLLENELTPDQFENGVIGAGCREIMTTLERIPGVSETGYSGYSFRHWVVSFRIDMNRPYAGKIIECLGCILNTQLLDRWMCWPFVLKPESHFVEDPASGLWWELQTVVPMINPAEVAEYLLDELPEGFDTEAYWRAGL